MNFFGFYVAVLLLPLYPCLPIKRAGSNKQAGKKISEWAGSNKSKQAGIIQKILVVSMLV